MFHPTLVSLNLLLRDTVRISGSGFVPRMSVHFQSEQAWRDTATVISISDSMLSFLPPLPQPRTALSFWVLLPSKFGVGGPREALGIACKNDPTGDGQDELRLRLVASVSVPDFPAGLALSPNGSWLAVTSDNGDAVTLLDAETFDFVASAEGLASPHGVAFSVTGDLLVVAARSAGVFGFDVPALTERFRVDFLGLMVLADLLEEHFYVNGRTEDIIRVTDGQEARRFQDDEPPSMALSIDGNVLFVASEFPTNRILSLRTPSLDLEQEHPLPLRSGVVVPLRSGLIRIFGYARVDPSGPLVSVLYDPASQTVSAVDTLDAREVVLTFGGGSPWTAVAGDKALVPTNIGTIVLDYSTGDVLDFLEVTDFSGLALVPCCDIIFDSSRERVIFSDVSSNAIYVFALED